MSHYCDLRMSTADADELKKLMEDATQLPAFLHHPRSSRGRSRRLCHHVCKGSDPRQDLRTCVANEDADLDELKQKTKAGPLTSLDLG